MLGIWHQEAFVFVKQLLENVANRESRTALLQMEAEFEGHEKGLEDLDMSGEAIYHSGPLERI